jgi:hypothetical protein
MRIADSSSARTCRSLIRSAMLVHARRRPVNVLASHGPVGEGSRGAFQAAPQQFGRRGVIELSLIMGNYSLLALLINSFDTDLPPDRTEPLLAAPNLTGGRRSP